MQMLALTCLLVLAADRSADTVVVCPPAFREALQPWLEHRAAQGHRFAFVANEQSPTEIQADIRRIAQSGALRAIVLVGDADPRADTDEQRRAISIPTFHAEARVNVMWGSEPLIATDNPYADLDDDLLPDVAIGRLSVDSAAELTRVVKKIIDYEQSRQLGTWRRRVNFVAGVGGFGPVVDNVIESATRKFLTDGIPAAYETSMTYGSWRSPFCPDPRFFHQATLDRLNEGSLFWVYLGHGQRRYLDRVRTPGGQYHIFHSDDMAKVQLAGGAPIAIFLACYTGSFDELAPCLGEEMLRAEAGPVAVLCGSRVTMPYAMAVMGSELMDQYFRERRETLGELVLLAKREMASPLDEAQQAAKANRHLLDTLAAVISPAPDLLAEERREHVLMFNLLGDPLMRLEHPHPITVSTLDEIHAGSELIVSGTTGIAGRCTIELICRRDRLKSAAPTREVYDDRDNVLASYTDVYAQANDRQWCSYVFDCEAGDFSATLTVPAEARGPSHVRVFVENAQGHGLGATNLYVRRPPLASP